MVDDLGWLDGVLTLTTHNHSIIRELNKQLVRGGWRHSQKLGQTVDGVNIASCEQQSLPGEVGQLANIDTSRCKIVAVVCDLAVRLLSWRRSIAPEGLDTLKSLPTSYNMVPVNMIDQIGERWCPENPNPWERAARSYPINKT